MNPWNLAWGLALGSLLSEDGALLGSAALIASHQLSFEAAFAANVLGIGAGDLGLYGLGRAAGWKLQSLPGLRRLFTRARLERGRSLIEAGGPGLILATRFMPGSRLPCYSVAGITRSSFAPFAAAVLASTLCWVGLVLGSANYFGSRVSPWALLPALILAALLLRWIFQGFAAQQWRLRLNRLRRWGHAEFWPPWAFYLPVALRYLWLSLRYGHPLLPSLANPGIEGGGLINESKEKIYALLPSSDAVLKCLPCQPGTSASAIQAWMRSEGLGFPIIAKPDQGQRGSGVRLLHSEPELSAHAAQAGYRYLVQEYCAYAAEAGVFYVRRPWEEKGWIFSVTEKHFPHVQGNGRDSLASLILADPRLRLQADIFFERHAGRLATVLPAGQRLRLAEAGNHCQGTLFTDGKRLAGEGLSSRLDGICKAMPGFFIGRFDLRYQDEAAFQAGQGFKIIELNGAGAEATHIYDPALSLWQAYGVLFEQWGLMFEIGAWQRAQGLKPLSLRQFLAEALAYRRAARLHPQAT